MLEVGPKFLSRNHKTFRSHIRKVSAKVMHPSGAKQHRYNTINSQHSSSWRNTMVEKKYICEKYKARNKKDTSQTLRWHKGHYINRRKEETFHGLLLIS